MPVSGRCPARKARNPRDRRRRQRGRDGAPRRARDGVEAAVVQCHDDPFGTPVSCRERSAITGSEPVGTSISVLAKRMLLYLGELEEEPIPRSTTATLRATPLFINTVSLQLGNTKIQLRALWDGGATDSIIHSPKALNYFAKDITPAMVTLAGYSETDEHDEPQLAEGQILPTLHVLSEEDTISIQHPFLLARISSLYDILIGRDLMVRLRAVEDYERRIITLHPPAGKMVSIIPDVQLGSTNSITSKTEQQLCNSILFEGVEVDVGILEPSQHDRFHALLTK